MLIYSYLHCKRALTALAAAGLLISVRPLTAQVDVGLAPMRVDFAAVPGRNYSGSMTLTNAGSEKVRLRAELLDFYVDENTTPQFLANVPAEADYSCRSWLSVNPMELEMEPRSQTSARYTVRLPASATERSYHCALGFRTMLPAAEITGTGMRAAVRLVSVIYPVVGKPPITGEIKELQLEQVTAGAGTGWRGIVIMENTGLMLYRPAGTLEILDSSGNVIESQKLASFPVLPKRKQRFLLPFKTKFAPGQYTLRAKIEVGTEIQEASAVVTAGAPQQATAPAATGTPAQ